MQRRGLRSTLGIRKSRYQRDWYDGWLRARERDLHCDYMRFHTVENTSRARYQSRKAIVIKRVEDLLRQRNLLHFRDTDSEHHHPRQSEFWYQRRGYGGHYNEDRLVGVDSNAFTSVSVSPPSRFVLGKQRNCSRREWIQWGLQF
jgi:hypothetical protein